jgi:hypothetical protein
VLQRSQNGNYLVPAIQIQFYIVDSWTIQTRFFKRQTHASSSLKISLATTDATGTALEKTSAPLHPWTIAGTIFIASVSE